MCLSNFASLNQLSKLLDNGQPIAVLMSAHVGYLMSVPVRNSQIRPVALGAGHKDIKLKQQLLGGREEVERCHCINMN